MTTKMRKLITIVEGRKKDRIEKFWIDSNSGIIEVIEGNNPEHETDLPGDGNLGFKDSIKAGWVRGGVKTDKYDDTTMYIMARDKVAARKAMTTALSYYSPSEINIEWSGGNYHRLDAEDAEAFVKHGGLPRF